MAVRRNRIAMKKAGAIGTGLFNSTRRNAT